MKVFHGSHNIPALVILLILLTFAIRASSGIAEDEHKFLDDPAMLKFRVQDATDTKERLNAGGVIIAPQKTFKLIIVTLAGTSPCDCRVAFEPREFTLAYLTPFVAKPREKRFAPNLTPAAFLLHAGTWSVVPHDSSTAYTISAYSLKSGQEFVLTIGFLVRDDVQSFVVRYPTSAGFENILSPDSRT
jgi:hypothetical protein